MRLLVDVSVNVLQQRAICYIQATKSILFYEDRVIVIYSTGWLHMGQEGVLE